MRLNLRLGVFVGAGGVGGGWGVVRKRNTSLSTAKYELILLSGYAPERKEVIYTCKRSHASVITCGVNGCAHKQRERERTSMRKIRT